jgi:formylglycine-generating enzyme required for sulfatase activity/uncharacterized caspase-like protein
MTKVALLIGVSEYRAGFTPIPSAVKDVDALYRVLVDPERGDFLSENIICLKNPDRQKMEDAIHSLFHDRQKEDLVLFYFSGHGIKDAKNKLYLGTCITQKDNSGSLVPTSAVDATTLHDRMESSKSQRKVIILDSCYSGAIAQGMTVKDDGTVRLEDLGGKGRAILTSSTATQYSIGAEATEYGITGLSIYTRYLVEGIETGAADLDEDDWISVDELHKYAAERVQQAAPTMTPKFFPVEEGYNIRLAKSRSNDPKLKYEREVQKRAEEGNGGFSIFVRQILLGKQQEWGISPEDANIIQSRVLQPYHEYQGKLAEYERLLVEAVQIEYPFGDRTQADLQQYQQYLKLRSEDIAEIHERVLPKAADPSSSRNKGRLSFDRRNFLKFFTLGGSGLLLALLMPSDQKQPSLSTVEFASVKLAEWGNISGRPKGQCQVYQEDLGNKINLTMVKIPKGKFFMGSDKTWGKTEEGHLPNEEPRHEVIVPEFYMGQTLVTHSQWNQIMDDGSFSLVSGFPKQGVSWWHVQAFIQQLSKQTQRKYRLPTEAEWEYACRSGTSTPFYCGNTIDSEIANYYAQDYKFKDTIIILPGKYGNGKLGNRRGKATEVIKFPPNPFGLYDMCGNLLEWCQDHWHDDYKGAPLDGSAWLNSVFIFDNGDRIMRGGSYDSMPVNCRSAMRFHRSADANNANIGFRVVCEI